MLAHLCYICSILQIATWPNSASELELSLQVLHAYENGPVVCQVSVTNVSARKLLLVEPHYGSVYCLGTSEWSKGREYAGLSNTGNSIPCVIALAPGEKKSKVFYLHQDYLRIPAGNSTIHYGWEIWRTRPGAGKDSKEIELLFHPRGRHGIEILPATAENLRPLRQHLEREFNRLRPSMLSPLQYWWASDDASADLAATLAGCRHEEFVPLLLKAIDLMPAGEFRQTLIQTVYDGQPSAEQAFSVFARYLHSTHPAAASDVFQSWKDQEWRYQNSAARVLQLTSPFSILGPLALLAKETKLFSDLPCWKWAADPYCRQKHADARLTREQTTRLLDCPNVWVRALLYAHYPERCPAAWRSQLEAELKKTIAEPERLRDLVALLGDDQFQVRELATKSLLAFGPNWIPFYKALGEETQSAEAARRLQQIITELDDLQYIRCYTRAIAHIAKSTENREILKLLVTSDCPNLVSAEASSALWEQTVREFRNSIEMLLGVGETNWAAGVMIQVVRTGWDIAEWGLKQN